MDDKQRIEQKSMFIQWHGKELTHDEFERDAQKEADGRLLDFVRSACDEHRIVKAEPDFWSPDDSLMVFYEEQRTRNGRQVYKADFARLLAAGLIVATQTAPDHYTDIRAAD